MFFHYKNWNCNKNINLLIYLQIVQILTNDSVYIYVRNIFLVRIYIPRSKSFERTADA